MNTCVFLNLAAAAARRAGLEASFAAAAPGGWRLRRFEAVGPDRSAALPGALSPPEKGCFASHRNAMGEALQDDGHLMVVEDDARFSRATFAVLDGLLTQAEGWDVVFTDAALYDLNLLASLIRRRDAMAARGEFNLLDLAGRPWSGSAAYCVRGPAKRKVFEALQTPSLDTPYDLHLRRLADEGALKVGVCFPFLTTVAAEGDESQIQDGENAFFDHTLNACRRLLHVERDLEQCRRDAERLRAACDEASLMAGTVFAAIVSPRFPFER